MTYGHVYTEDVLNGVDEIWVFLDIARKTEFPRGISLNMSCRRTNDESKQVEAILRKRSSQLRSKLDSISKVSYI